MPIPNVKQTILDGKLGALPAVVEGLSAKIGICSLGVVNSVISLTPQSKKDIPTLLGFGPLAEAAAYHLDASGQPLLVVPANPGTAGSNSSVTRTGTGTATAAASGAPKDSYDAIFEILTGAPNLAGGGAVFRFSMDGGDTFSAPTAMPTNGIFAIAETGVTITWSYTSGTGFVAGDKYTFTSTAPNYTLTDLNAAIDALAADPRRWRFLHVVGAGSAAIFASIASKLAAVESSQSRYAYALMEAVDQAGGQTEDAWMTALIAEYASSANVRMDVAAGACELVSAISGRIYRRQGAWVIAARRAKVRLSEDCARVASGPVVGVVKLYHDEEVKPGLDDKKFSTLRTFNGEAGFWITNDRIMSAVGSDFEFTQHRQVMDVACEVARSALLRYLSESILVDRETGKIDEPTARAIEATVNAQLEAALVQPVHASATAVTIDRNVNILSTKKLVALISVVPLGYAKSIEVEIGFQNPALALK